LTIGTRAIPHASLCWMTPGSGPHKHGPGRKALRLVFKQRERSCRRWQLSVCRRFYEGVCTSACTTGFATHVETRSPPWETSLGRPGPITRKPCLGWYEIWKYRASC
jgi:hypothetical protein